ncbi:MAG: glycoside hydrolase family 38 C-terminal domain-containing protein [Planctomycetota bacterium]
MKAKTITVHMVGQAHLDPIWLWPWQAGLDAALATCRTACDLLDEYPDFVYTHSQAWTYQQIEETDPDLFARIRAHVIARRWEVAGGWWVQPDCNFPGRLALERQIEVGRRYLEDRFGVWPGVAYNVDSFGHSAGLPAIMRAAGQRYYVMMRPQEHEMTLPARVFRWRGRADGPEVTTFRIAGAYNSPADGLRECKLRQAASDLPAGLTHTMCFYGVGDHGGGPTAALIEWIDRHRHAVDGLRLIFSAPSRFFAALEADAPHLPTVTGELQHHAIGCYSVRHGLKATVRRSVHLLAQAEELTGARPADSEPLEKAWRHVSFAQFHDTLGGTCIPSAYPQVAAQLGAARATADGMLQRGLRRRMRDLPDDSLQRIVVCNASDSAFEGYVEAEPWTQWQPWQPEWRLLDEVDEPVPFQLLPPESLRDAPRLAFRAELRPGELAVFRIDRGSGPPEPRQPMAVREAVMEAAGGGAVDLRRDGEMHLGGVALPLPRLALVDDRTDNWAHGIDRFPEGPVVSARWNAPCVLHHGALVSSLYRTGAIGGSPLREEWRLYAEEGFVELRLEVHWTEKQKLLKLVVPLPEPATRRVDGITAGSLERENDGRERPLRDWTLCPGQGGGTGVAVVCPEVYALDGLPQRLRFTMLRSPMATHHDPWKADRPNPDYTDQGVSRFRFRFYGRPEVTVERLEADSLALHRPPLVAHLTRGMPRGCP